MRGKVGLLLLLRSRSWITPAYAGKSDSFALHHDANGDHPRICGEKYYTLRRDQLAEGSPPHMRGKEINGVL